LYLRLLLLLSLLPNLKNDLSFEGRCVETYEGAGDAMMVSEDEELGDGEYGV